MQYVIDLQIGPYAHVLGALRREIAQPDRILASVGESLLNANQDRHARNVAPDGTPWAPLARTTLYRAVEARQSQVTSAGNTKRGAASNVAKAQKIMANKASRILYQYGDLLRFAYQVEGGQLRVGTNDAKAAWHHLGTGTHGPKGTPYAIRPRGKRALAFGGGVYKRVMHPGVPARPLVGFPTGDQTIVESIVAEHLAAAAQAAAQKK
jgi:phage gpG-like protein